MLRPTLLLTLLTSLTLALPSTNNPRAEKKKNPKYFHEMSGSQALIHYDRRFFTGKEISYDRHRYVLKGLITSYLDFFDSHNKETWIAHGTLLGWWWNGKIMPWDLDLDTQVTAGTMQWLGDNHNQSTHPWEYTIPLEHGAKEERVKTEYFLDVNPHHNDTEVDRMNIIDARWIDKGTGMYIDLTVLKERDPVKKPGVWSCTNNHRYKNTDLWPLRVTEFEGVKALIPKEFEKILADEYGRKGLTLKDFHDHQWHPQTLQWIKKDAKEREQRVLDASAAKSREMSSLSSLHATATAASSTQPSATAAPVAAEDARTSDDAIFIEYNPDTNA